MSFGNAWRLQVGEGTGPPHRNRRLVAIRRGLFTGLASRALALVVSLVSVPLTIRYLGTERFGVWAVIGSILAWMRLMDIGIGNGLNNAISHAHGSDRPDLIRAHVSSALVMLTGIATAIGAVIALAWHWVNWVAVFGLTSANARAEAGPAMAAAAVVFLVGFPTSVATRVYNAIQEGRVANAWTATGNLASLAALIVVTRTQGGLPWLVIAVFGTAVLVDGLSSVWLYFLRRRRVRPSYRLFNRASARALLSTGVQFFLIQIMALVVFESDNFVIAHFLGADHVARYSVTYKLFSYTTLIQAVLFAYLWVAYGEAIARKDFDWVRRAFRANMAFSLGVTGALVLPLILLAKPLVHLWAGAAVVPTTELVLLMAAWSMINAYCSPIGCLFAASAHMRAQLVYSALATALNLGLSIILVQTWGISGVIAATVISYSVLICLPVTIDSALLLRRMP